MQRAYILPANAVHCIAAALVISLVTNVFVVFMHGGNRPHHQLLVDKDHPTSLPIHVRPAALTVVDTERYALESDVDWSSLIPNGHGFVRLGADQSYYAVAMYHQMHCLNGFRHLTLAGKNQTQHNIDHAIHCLSYLRQMVLCYADTTLEPARAAITSNGGKTQAVYGEGVTHQCRDWTQVRGWVEENYKEWSDDDHFEVSEGGLKEIHSHSADQADNDEETHSHHVHNAHSHITE